MVLHLTASDVIYRKRELPRRLRGRNDRRVALLGLNHVLSGLRLGFFVLFFSRLHAVLFHLLVGFIEGLLCCVVGGVQAVQRGRGDGDFGAFWAQNVREREKREYGGCRKESLK
jgi:hypothetical protein